MMIGTFAISWMFYEPLKLLSIGSVSIINTSSTFKEANCKFESSQLTTFIIITFIIIIFIIITFIMIYISLSCEILTKNENRNVNESYKKI